jgi:hypothetical protein
LPIPLTLRFPSCLNVLEARQRGACRGSRAEKRRRDAEAAAQDTAEEAGRAARYEHALHNANEQAAAARAAVDAARAEAAAAVDAEEPVDDSDSEEEELQRQLAKVQL